MATGPVHREVTIERTTSGQFVGRNTRGGRLPIGRGDDADFTPTELLMTAIGSCTGIDVGLLTSRRAEPSSFDVHVAATKVRDDGGNRLTGIQVTFRVQFPDGEQGDAARAVLPDIVRRSHDRLCTVSRTIELGTPVATRIE